MYAVENEHVGEWTSKIEIRTSKKFQAAGEACVAVFWPIPGFKGKTFTALCSQQRDLNFCICITPTAGVLLRDFSCLSFLTCFYSSFCTSWSNAIVMITTLNMNRDKHIETLELDITNMPVLGKNKQEEKRKVKYPSFLSTVLFST